MVRGVGSVCVHLAYLDDSGSEPKSPVVVCGGIVVPDEHFHAIESEIGWVVEQLIPIEQRDKFEEFHAAQLYGGFEIFSGIAEEERHEAIRQLLGVLDRFVLPYVYSAVSRERLLAGPFASAQPLDVAFRLCALEIERMFGWQLDATALANIRLDYVPQLCLLVVDDTEDKALKHSLKRSFRQLRLRRHAGILSPQHMERNKLWHLHDDMYFGDSKDSVGIQIADLCNYFMMRKLRGEDDGNFFDMLLPHAKYASPEPEFSQCKDWLLRH